MAEENQEEKAPSNAISPETGQYDARFVLWRTFCAENGVAVETLPSELEGETKEKWEKLKNSRLQGKG